MNSGWQWSRPWRWWHRWHWKQDEDEQWNQTDQTWHSSEDYTRNHHESWSAHDVENVWKGKSEIHEDMCMCSDRSQNENALGASEEKMKSADDEHVDSLLFSCRAELQTLPGRTVDVEAMVVTLVHDSEVKEVYAQLSAGGVCKSFLFRSRNIISEKLSTPRPRHIQGWLLEDTPGLLEYAVALRLRYFTRSGQETTYLQELGDVIQNEAGDLDVAEIQGEVANVTINDKGQLTVQ